jgi:hypothetical protein
MGFDWGPHFIVPSEMAKTFKGAIRLREKYDEDLLRQELDALGLSGGVIRVTNPWYYRKKGTETWIKIGESEDKNEDFPVRWDTSTVEQGSYEVLGLMHVFVKMGDETKAIARQNIVEVTVEQ